MWRLYRLYQLYPARLLAAPAARVVGRSCGRILVAFDGLVCEVRTARALARMRGVAAVEVGIAAIEHSRTVVDGRSGVDEDALQRALEGVVVAPGLRRRPALWGAHLCRQRHGGEQRSVA